MEGRISLCFWSDSKQIFTIFLVPPLIHTQKTYTNLTLCIVIHILFHTSHITNDLCRTTKYYHIKQQYTAIPASLTLITPLIGRINTSARSQHTSHDRIDPPGHTPADLHPLISSRRCISIPGDRDPSRQFAQRSHNHKRSRSSIIS